MKIKISIFKKSTNLKTGDGLACALNVMLIIEPSVPTSIDNLSATLTRGESLFTGSNEKDFDVKKCRKTQKIIFHKEINCEAIFSAHQAFSAVQKVCKNLCNENKSNLKLTEKQVQDKPEQRNS